MRIKETVARAGVALGVGDPEEERGDELAHIVATRRELPFERGAPPSLRVGLVEEEPGDRAVLEGVLVAVVVGLVVGGEEPIHRLLVQSVHIREASLSAAKPLHLAVRRHKPGVNDGLVAVRAKPKHARARFGRDNTADFVRRRFGRFAIRVDICLDVAALVLLRDGVFAAHALARPPVVVEHHHLHAALLALVEDDVHIAPPPLAHPVDVRARLDREDALPALVHAAHVLPEPRLRLRAVHPEERPRVLAHRALRRTEVVAHVGRGN